MRYRVMLIVLLACGLLAGCKKKDEGSGGCGTSGGVTLPNIYIFWMSQDLGCGYLTVEVKDADGLVVRPNNHGQVRVVDVIAPGCNSAAYTNHANFDLYRGEKYTWKATCTGRQWTGTITVPCEQNKCYPIQIL